MSLYGAMFSGVSALSSESSAMGAISDNISNINTIGYKNTTVNFQTLVTKQVSLTEYSPGGVQSKPRANINSQGVLQASTSSTDISISGQGFFPVNSQATPLKSGGGEFAYTRAGSFIVDKDGYLKNASGYYLQGWPLQGYDGTATASHQLINGTQFMKAYKNDSGSYTYINDGVVDPTNLQPLNLNNIAGTASATTDIQLGANLPSGATVGHTENTNLLEYDSLGNSHNVLLNWTKSAQNQWALGVTPPEGATTVSLADAKGNTYSASGRLDFSALPTISATTTIPNTATGTAVPDSNFTMQINGTTYTFVVGSGTSGTPANTLWADPTGLTSPATYAQNMSAEINKAFLSQYAGATAGGAFAGPGAAGTISIAVNGTTSVVNYNAGDSIATIVSDINNVSSTTGVHAWNNGGTLQYYTTNGQAVAATITDSNADPELQGAAGPLTVTGTGLTYVSQVAGTGSIVFNQYDTTNAITVNGLTNLTNATGNYAFEQAYNPNTTTPTTFVLNKLASQVFSGTTATANNPISGTLTPAITFNGDGTPKTVNVSQMLVTWANGSQDQTTKATNGISPPIGLFLGDTNVSDGMTQLSGSYSLTYMNQNGAKFGNFQSLSVDSAGIVTAQFDNGVTRPIFQIPVATFVNPDGMDSLTGNVFIGTDFSGLPTLRTPGDAGSGTINQSSLEASTVDLGTEFTTMIVTQRAYSAAAKVITTSDQMLDDLINIKR
jgi:flagellar hook protein FlgE